MRLLSDCQSASFWTAESTYTNSDMALEASEAELSSCLFLFLASSTVTRDILDDNAVLIDCQSISSELHRVVHTPFVLWHRELLVSLHSGLLHWQ